MEIFITAFALGLAGSFHCIGMCGPIALSLPLRGNTYSQKILGGMLYNIGRASMYGIMGGIFGLLGQGFHLLGFQRWVSIGMGLLLIASVLLSKNFKNIKLLNIHILTGWVRKSIQQLFIKKSYGGLFFIGTLNSLLPCGLVYMAIAGAIGTGTVYFGMIYMVIFGFGTIPLMLLVVLAGNAISLSVRTKINQIIPYLVVFIGCVFILRGLCLGIPYLSPPENKLSPSFHVNINKSQSNSNITKEACCHK